MGTVTFFRTLGTRVLLSAVAALLLSGAAVPQQNNESDPEAIRFLEEAEARMYNPLREGLRTLSFSRIVESSMGPIGTQRFYFKAPNLRASKFEINESHPQKDVIKALRAQTAEMDDIKNLDTLGLYVGNFITHDLDQYRVRFLGDRTGSVRIRCEANPSSPFAKYISCRDLLFDESGLLRGIKVVNAQGRTQMLRIHLKELKGTGQYVYERIEFEIPTPQGMQKTIQTFTRKEVHGYHLITNTTQKFDVIGLEQKMPTKDIRVNEPIADSVFGREKSGEESKEQSKAKEGREEKMNIDSIHWLGHDAFRIDGPPVVYFDPWNLKEGLPKADIICVTHDHYDHFSKDDIDKISGPDTVIFTTKAVAAQITGSARGLDPGDSGEAHGVKIQTTPAYNVNKQFHPQKSLHLGFIVEVNGMRIYHAGDTDFIPEMKEIRCDVALLPVSGTYVMTAEEAVKAAEAINPKITIPMHYGEIVGSLKDAERFKELYKGECRILDKEEEKKEDKE